MTTEKTREWQKAHPEKMREYVKRWQQKNPDKVKAYNHNYYLRKKALKEAKHDGNLRTDQSGE